MKGWANFISPRDYDFFGGYVSMKEMTMGKTNATDLHLLRTLNGDKGSGRVDCENERHVCGQEDENNQQYQ